MHTFAVITELTFHMSGPLCFKYETQPLGQFRITIPECIFSSCMKTSTRLLRNYIRIFPQIAHHYCQSTHTIQALFPISNAMLDANKDLQRHTNIKVFSYRNRNIKLLSLALITQFCHFVLRAQKFSAHTKNVIVVLLPLKFSRMHCIAFSEKVRIFIPNIFTI